MQIPYFREVFMRDTLPKRVNKIECLILNHDVKRNRGTHWTAVVKIADKAYYFDSYGKLPPPIELVEYLGKKTQILYNYTRYQKFNTVVCGHLCLRFLHEFWMKNGNLINTVKR